MLYSARNLKKIYNGRTVLDVSELSVLERKIYALMGPNGSGKTTLLHILSFISTPTSGTLFYNDRPVQFAEKALQPLRKEVVLLHQHPILFSTSVYKNVEFGLKMRNIPKIRRRKIVEESLDLVGMRGFAKADAPHLSGGETQRVAIARALACAPKVIMFDEPTASVDVESQIAIENIILDIQQEKDISVIVCTHNPMQALKLADETLFLFEGRTSDSIFENVFSGDVIDVEGKRFCRVQNKVLIPVQTHEHGRIKISINPKSIQVSDFAETDGTAIAHKGRLFQITEEKNWVRMLVDIGIPLSVLMKRKEYDKRGIGIGRQVYVTCLDYGVEVIGGQSPAGQ
ncbi:MAG: ATP-binding cassette domain-containing protein [Desulfobacterales bacterium]|nr:ATP-binding cassette domain-containing protein [Desulfobacterales bacterium]MDD4071861.1 ATP-binding cassette domain-containing protein [Desulfobacterales bacterium]MDD4391522.1 ATP-binding cassette domain-containing protein [Desulfobacterales bacterium]